MTTILGCDVGKKGGWAVIQDGKFVQTGIFNFVSLVETRDYFDRIIKVHNPDCIITGKPNRMYNIVLNHGMYIGVLSMLAEDYNIPITIINDCTMRAYIFGKGNGMKKDLVHEKYKGLTPDVSDAMLFSEYLYLKQNE